MPLQNRVTPLAEIVADPARGLMMGNRGGALHAHDRTLGARRWVSRQWICCVLQFNDRRRSVMVPGRYTELFFLDEATALAAGHRPCFECRRADAMLFAQLWTGTCLKENRARAAAIDLALHAERLDRHGRQRRHPIDLDDLAAGSMYLDPEEALPWLVLDTHILRWTPAGYRDPRSRPSGRMVAALTPPRIIAVLNSGYRPLLHETARVSR